MRQVATHCDAQECEHLPTIEVVRQSFEHTAPVAILELCMHQRPENLEPEPKPELELELELKLELELELGSWS